MVGLLVAVLVGLFPPARFLGQGWTKFESWDAISGPHGRIFLFSIPHVQAKGLVTVEYSRERIRKRELGRFMEIRIDYARLLIEWIVIAIATGCVCFARTELTSLYTRFYRASTGFYRAYTGSTGHAPAQSSKKDDT